MRYWHLTLDAALHRLNYSMFYFGAEGSVLGNRLTQLLSVDVAGLGELDTHEQLDQTPPITGKTVSRPIHCSQKIILPFPWWKLMSSLALPGLPPHRTYGFPDLAQ